MVDGCLGVDGLPEHDDVDHHAERAELAFLAGLVALGEFAESAAEDIAGEAVAAFAAVQDALDILAVGGVVAVVQDVQGLDDPSEFDERPGESGRVRSALQGPHDCRGDDGAGFDGSGEPTDLVPFVGDEFGVDLVAGEAVERPVVGGGLDAPERWSPRSLRRGA